ncbi:MAG: 2-C-methyl-D-erythritol 2,4-cyclodiphosphate synthase [Spirochaetaceae bacterium]|nr:2-C-methyl-D-erythritol 2,4-cyclodiphosphate synthase [Spirochaetaceae bacterium]
MRIGTGWDLHLLKEGRRLMLGGEHIPFHSGEEAHSDGDVLIHAIIDAILGAAALGDIGTHFPPSDKKYKDISSLILLGYIRELLIHAGYRIVNIDTTIILQKPRLNPYIKKIRKKLEEALSLDLEYISVKAKTKEGIDAVGRGEAIEASASVLIEEIDNSVWL